MLWKEKKCKYCRSLHLVKLVQLAFYISFSVFHFYHRILNWNLMLLQIYPYRFFLDQDARSFFVSWCFLFFSLICRLSNLNSTSQLQLTYFITSFHLRLQLTALHFWIIYHSLFLVTSLFKSCLLPTEPSISSSFQSKVS